MAHVDRHQAATICGVKAGTIDVWVNRGHITKHSDGYDVNELLTWLDTRDPNCLFARAGLSAQVWAAIPLPRHAEAG